MSLAETQQIFQYLTAIEEMLKNIEVQIQTINSGKGSPKSIDTTIDKLRTFERVAARYLLLVQRMGLPDDQQQLIQVGSKIVIVFNQMYMAGTLLFASPTGAILGVAALALAQLTIMEGY